MRRTAKISPGEIVIEIATKQNSNVLFHPLGSVTLRGRWDPSNVRLDWDDDSPYRGLPLVPGIYVCLDVKGRTLRGVDPLGLEQNEGLLETVKACAKADQGEVGPMLETRLERLNETEIKTALYRMWEAVDSKHAVVVQGEFPKREVILAMPGQLLLRAGGFERCYDPLYSLDKPLPPFATDAEMERLGAIAAKA